MKQNLYTYYRPYSGEIALSATIHAFFSRAVIPAQAGIYRKPFSLTSPFPRTWNQRIKQRNAFARLTSHMLADTGITEAQRLAEVNKPFWRA